MIVSSLFTILYWAWIATEVLLQLVTPTLRRHGKADNRVTFDLMAADGIEVAEYLRQRTLMLRHRARAPVEASSVRVSPPASRSCR